MRAIAYRVTKHTIPAWAPLHNNWPRGIGYETETHFVHVFGKDRGIWDVSNELIFAEAKSGSLSDWVERTFGACDIVELTHSPGCATKGVWRPGLYLDDDVQVALETSVKDTQLAEQALLLLIERLDEILNFVEPTATSLKVYSHKSRELLILACTEVENFWSDLLRIADPLKYDQKKLCTNDYMKLKKPLFLEEYVLNLPRYECMDPESPFVDWTSESPTESIAWYDAYNKTKHNRAIHFDKATLENCILAVMANVVLFSVRFGPYRLLNGAGSLPSYFNRLMALELKECDPKSFYVPRINVPRISIHPNATTGIFHYNRSDGIQRWKAEALSISTLHPHTKVGC